ncbi:DUF5403 family protein [Herbiconiux sp. UC225_62]|uniref:DUF5403 family protein n=1 Tax=Herbiconiux sp. UC225_62 TaxID=3350168 RepID=UPI0036D2A7A4
MAQVYKPAGIIAARIAGESAAMDLAALVVLGRVKMVAARHRLTGNYMRSLEIKKVRGRNGVKDRLVSATDPAAISIEYGHYPVRIRRKKHAGSRRVSTGTIRWVPGQYIMTKARGML